MVSIAIRMIMSPRPAFFLFTAAQRSERRILAMPFRQISAARQGLAVITLMVIAVRPSSIRTPTPEQPADPASAAVSRTEAESIGTALGDLFRRQRRPAVTKV